ncbi:unnamed protein product [Adineta ricciae]|uniref:Uncharacterized protein n=1 Tax=Adineta ricciae TaxID=249248 RepID=A0A813Q4Y0_ADIRI|nr:unnamed protein product [Adineta ricciae]
MNRHHEDLTNQFQLIINGRSQLNESLKTIESQLENDDNVPCIAAIYQWQTETIRLVENVAATVRRDQTTGRTPPMSTKSRTPENTERQRTSTTSAFKRMSSTRFICANGQSAEFMSDAEISTKNIYSEPGASYNYSTSVEVTKYSE